MRMIVQRNQAAFEPFAEELEEALEFVKNNPHYSLYGERFDSFNEQGNSDDQLEFRETHSAVSTLEGDECMTPDQIMSERS